MLVAAVDNLGGKYLSFLDTNSNSTTTEIVLNHLIKVLDAEDSEWRSSSILLLE